MISMRRGRGLLFIGGLMLIACAAWAIRNSSTLFVEGQLASSDVRVINGKGYVPIRDVAAALHMNLVSYQGGINLTRAGGANQVEGWHGVVGGPEIFTGKWRFWARSIQQMDSYPLKYRGEAGQMVPTNAGETLFVVDCRIKNATNVNQEMILTVHRAGHDALTDDQEHSFQPIDFDAHNENGPYGGPTLLPGAAGEFAVVFSAPKGTNPKDFVFSILSSPADTEKGTDLRISVQK